MTKSKNILSTVFSTSLLVLPLLLVQVDGQAAKADEPTGTSEGPLKVPTKILYCNRTSYPINSTMSYGYPNVSTLNWRRLDPGGCRRITFDKGYEGTLSFYVDTNGNRPLNRTPVAGGKYCFDYSTRNNHLQLTPTTCPPNL